MTSDQKIVAVGSLPVDDEANRALVHFIYGASTGWVAAL